MSLSLVFVRLLVIFGISVRKKKKKKKFSYRGKMNLMIIKEVGKM